MNNESGLKTVTRLLGMVSPVIPAILFSIFMGILGNLCAIGVMVGGSLLIADIMGINSGFSSESLTLFVIACALFRGILRYMEQYSGHDAALRLIALIRNRAYEALRKLTPAKIVDKRSGDVIFTVMGDVEHIEVFFAHTIAPVIIAIVISLIMLIFVGRYWIGFSLILLFFQLCIGLLIPLIASKMGRKAGREYRKRSSDINTYFLDSLQGLKELLIFNRGHERLEEIKKHGNELNHSYSQLKKHEGFVLASADTFVILAIISMLFAGMQRFTAGMLDVGEIIIITVAASCSFGPLTALSALSNNLMQTFAAAERIFALIDEEPSVKESIVQNHNTITKSEDISYHNVHFNYPKNLENVLENLNFNISPGSHIAIVGKSGSGKSTILRLLLRFWDVSAGEITVNGKDIRDIPLSMLRSGISMVSQETYLFNETIEENIRIGKPDASIEEIEEAAKNASIHDFIITLPEGYQTRAGELGSRLSGGEKQRICLARAFIRKSPIMLLDEPTSNLDTLNEKIILKALNEECRDKTVVTVSHRPTAVARADRIWILENGRIVKEEMHKELFESKLGVVQEKKQKI